MAFSQILKKNFSHQFWFFLLLLFLPTQLGFHLWPPFSYVRGIRVDYLSLSFYLSDILLIITFLTWTLETRAKKAGLTGFWTHNKFFLATLIFLIFFNIFFALSPALALIKWIKVAELTLLFVYVKNNTSLLFQKTSLLAISLALIYSSALALLQFVSQRTLGGLFYFLGERSFSSSTPGIALGKYFFDENALLMRPYSTFPHPNVLAGFSLVLILLLIYAHLKTRRRFGGLAFSAVILSASSIALSLSSGAWISFFIVVAVIFLNRKRPKLLSVLAFSTLFSSLLFSLTFGGLSNFWSELFSGVPDAIQKRIDLAGSAFRMFLDSPVYGVGLNNFIALLPAYGAKPEISWFLQPVHNLTLLVLSETGAFGLVLFFYIIARSLTRMVRANQTFLIGAFLVILLTGTFDHYWLTLQATQLLFVLVLGLAA